MRQWGLTFESVGSAIKITDPTPIGGIKMSHNVPADDKATLRIKQNGKPPHTPRHHRRIHL